MLDELTKNLNPRMIFLLLLAVAVLISSTAYSMWFKKPIKEYQQLQTRYETLQSQPSDLASVEMITYKLRNEIDDLNAQLTEIGREVLKGTKPLSVISDLGAYAKQHSVQMASIKPAKPVKGTLYTEVPFHVELSGDYGQLFKWVYALEHSNSPLFIKAFSMRSESGEEKRKMQLTIGLIQPLQGEG